MPGLKQQTFGSPAPSAPPAAFDVEKFLSGVQHNWLLDKIESFFAGDTPAQVNTDLQAALDQLAVAMQDGVQVVTDIGELLWTGLQEPFASSGSAQQAQLAEFVGLLKQAVHDLLAFADAIVQALIDLAKAAMDELGGMLSHGFEDIPLVSKLLAAFGVDTTMNVGHLVSLILMYPATLANRIKNGAGTSLFPAVTACTAEPWRTPRRKAWAFGLGLSAAVGQGIWGAADAVGRDLSRVVGQEPSGIIGWIDIASPLVLAILGWPGTPAGPPFANPIDGSGPDGAMIWPNWLLGLVPPIVGLCGQFADYKPPAAVEASDGEPEDLAGDRPVLHHGRRDRLHHPRQYLQLPDQRQPLHPGRGHRQQRLERHRPVRHQDAGRNHQRRIRDHQALYRLLLQHRRRGPDGSGTG